MAEPGKEHLQYADGVYISPASREKFKEFEASYLVARQKENRILSIEDIRSLPFPKKESPDYELWKIRRKNIHRFENYLSEQKKGIRILDIGCGNGFFTHLLSKHDNKVVGIDVNLTELQQAATAFPSGHIHWYYLDILNEILPEDHFDIITFNASFHYFKDPAGLLKICHGLLKEHGEIHIIDSPFYDEEGKKKAQLNSRSYYSKINVESMIPYYHHNTYDALTNEDYTIKYKPGGLLQKILRRRDSPFPWIRIKKKNN